MKNNKGLANPITLGNSISNMILERIRQILVNLVHTLNITETYFDVYYPWSCILAAASFSIHSKTNGLKGYSPGQLLFGRDIILLIKDKVDW